MLCLVHAATVRIKAESHGYDLIASQERGHCTTFHLGFHSLQKEGTLYKCPAKYSNFIPCETNSMFNDTLSEDNK